MTDTRERVFSANAETNVLADVVRVLAEVGGCLVTDADSSPLVVPALEAAARTVEAEVPPLIEPAAVGDLLDERPGPVVVATLGDEAELLAEIEGAGVDVATAPLYRLWADIYVQKLSRFAGVARPTADDLFVRLDADLSSGLRGVRPYAIACTPRSGSTMLSDMLQQTGVAGHPREHLRAGMLALARATPFDLTRLAHAMVAGGTTPNGVFGTKLVSHFAFDLRSLHRKGLFDVDRLASLPWRLVRLRRSDTAAQALSAHLARESAVFFERNEERVARREAYLRDYEYDFDRIEAHHRELEENESRVDDLVAESGLPVIDVVYEEVLEDPSAELIRILRFLDIEIPPRFEAPLPAVKRLDDSLSAPILERYRAERAART